MNCCISRATLSRIAFHFLQHSNPTRQVFDPIRPGPCTEEYQFTVPCRWWNLLNVEAPLNANQPFTLTTDPTSPASLYLEIMTGDPTTRRFHPAHAKLDIRNVTAISCVFEVLCCPLICHTMIFIFISKLGQGSLNGRALWGYWIIQATGKQESRIDTFGLQAGSPEPLTDVIILKILASHLILRC